MTGLIRRLRARVIRHVIDSPLPRSRKSLAMRFLRYTRRWAQS